MSRVVRLLWIGFVIGVALGVAIELNEVYHWVTPN